DSSRSISRPLSPFTGWSATSSALASNTSSPAGDHCPYRRAYAGGKPHEQQRQRGNQRKHGRGGGREAAGGARRGPGNRPDDGAVASLRCRIGWRGEALRAVRTVVTLILNEGRVDRRRLVVDVEHYRNRREETVKEMALRLADRVRRTGERVMMDPMQSYERRIVHITLEKEPGIRTESQGEEPNRRVAILPDGVGAVRRPAERPTPASSPPLSRQETGYGDRPRYGDRPKFGDRPRFGERRPDYREGEGGGES